MTTSFGLTFTRNDLIKAALRTLGVIGQTQNPTTEDYNFCSEALNLMIKAWINKGATLWKIQEMALPMIPGIAQYPIGLTAGYLSSLGVTITDGGTGGSAGTYALGISDAGGGTGATGTYTISDGAVTTVTITAPGSGYVTPVLTFPSGGISGTTITITPVGLTTIRTQRILDHSNFLRNNSTGSDATLQMLSQTDYNALGNKTTSDSIPCQFFYNPLIPNGQLFAYPIPTDTGQSYTMHLFGQVTLDDVTGATDVFNFPQEFLNALKWGLSFELITEYGVDDRTEARIEKRYQMYVNEAFDFSVEEASTYFTYNSRGR